jgi:hypothetical protein
MCSFQRGPILRSSGASEFGMGFYRHLVPAGLKDKTKKQTDLVAARACHRTL